MSRFFHWYKKRLHTNPIITNSITAGFTCTIGDLGAQQIEKYQFNKKTERLKSPWSYNYQRTVKNFVYGLIFNGAPFYFWYKYLDILFPKPILTQVLSKVIINQIFLAPIMNITYFSYVAILLNYKNGPKDCLEKVKTKLEHSLIPTMITSCKVWPFIQLVNFYFLPPQYRTIYANAAGACWNIYLTLIGYKKN